MGNFICFTARARRFAQVFCDLCGKQFNKIINKNICCVHLLHTFFHSPHMKLKKYQLKIQVILAGLITHVCLDQVSDSRNDFPRAI